MVATKDIDNASELDTMLTLMQEMVVQCEHAANSCHLPSNSITHSI